MDSQLRHRCIDASRLTVAVGIAGALGGALAAALVLALSPEGPRAMRANIVGAATAVGLLAGMTIGGLVGIRAATRGISAARYAWPTGAVVGSLDWIVVAFICRALYGTWLFGSGGVLGAMLGAAIGCAPKRTAGRASRALVRACLAMLAAALLTTLAATFLAKTPLLVRPDDFHDALIFLFPATRLLLVITGGAVLGALGGVLSVVLNRRQGAPGRRQSTEATALEPSSPGLLWPWLTASTGLILGSALMLGLLLRDRVREFRTFQTAGLEQFHVVFSPDDRYVLACSPGERGSARVSVLLWDVASGKELRRFPTDAIGVALSPDSRDVAISGSDSSVSLRDIQTGQEIRSFRGGARSLIRKTAFSRDGDRLMATNEDGDIWVWDVRTGQQLHRSKIPIGRIGQESSWAWAFSPDGRSLLTGIGSLRLWNIDTGKDLRRFPKTENTGVQLVAFSADGRHALSTGPGFPGKYLVTLWDVEHGQAIRHFQEAFGGPYSSLAFSPDSRRVIAGTELGNVVVWDLETGQLLYRIQNAGGYIGSVALSSDNRLALAGTNWGLGVRIFWLPE
jgi:hypothetical protein